jgi:hypothetical protein
MAEHRSIARGTASGYRGAPSRVRAGPSSITEFIMSRIAVAILVSLLATGIAHATGAATGGCGDQSKVAPDQRVTNTARWTTASETDTFAYDVYRGDSENGKFVKITKKPILGNGTTSETHKYEFVDDTIDPCKEYWYYVEEITTSGERTKFTSVFKAEAKRHPVDAHAVDAKSH